MKKMKLAVFFAALVSVLSFSSCLDTNSESAYDGVPLVTVTGDDFLGYKLYADGGGILVPTVANMKQFGDWSKVKRAQVAFKHLDENLPEPSENAVYNVSIVSVAPLHGGADMIDTARDVEARDTLYNNQDPVIDLGAVGIYKGYITFTPQFNYNPSAPYYFNMSYEGEGKDGIDLENKKLTLTFHYDNGTEDFYNPVNDVYCSFPFAPELYRKFSDVGSDSINVVLRAVSDRNLENPNYLEKTVKMAVKDFRAPSYGY
ncbi:hypothetical protein [uncultured Phocaeicola sp.]|uniref:hypothetical protein n=1 Tax=uncultured Phocaeicola sp. TaxID=990718 RepID=UPI0025A4EA6C|nr:hypothetical protein [uncultured Phocaeicola sp.]